MFSPVFSTTMKSVNYLTRPVEQLKIIGSLPVIMTTITDAVLKIPQMPPQQSGST
jgi:hypothetical protein